MKELVESKVMVGVFILIFAVIYINSISIRMVEDKNVNDSYVYVNI